MGVFDVIATFRRLLKRGIGTVPRSGLVGLPTGPGRPVLDAQACDGCGKCVEVCPTHALAMGEWAPASRLAVDYGACISCLECVSACELKAWSASGEPLPISSNRLDLVQSYSITIHDRYGPEGDVDGDGSRTARILAD